MSRNNFEPKNNSKKQIEHISKQFFVCTPVKEIEWKNIFNNMNWEYQEDMLRGSVNSELVLQYPIKLAYQMAFVKHCITELEDRQLEIHDSFFDAIGRLMAVDAQNECYKHYIKNENEIITLTENANIISEGTTGLCSWQASILLSEWCMGNPEYLKSKTILELGSGIGLTGLTIFKYCKPLRIILSDCHKTVLDNLIGNIKINTKNILPDKIQPPRYDQEHMFRLENDSSVIEVYNFPWENVCKNTAEKLDVDLIIAADVVYDNSLFKNLISAVRTLLNYGKCKELILACTVRNKNTLTEFLMLLNDMNLVYEEMDLPVAKYYIWSNETPIRLFNIRIKK